MAVPRLSAPQSFQNDTFPVNSAHRVALGQTPLPQPAGPGAGAMLVASAALPGPGLREVTVACAPAQAFSLPLTHRHIARTLPGPPGRGEGTLNNRRL